jgi:lysine 6-dehydrogenase
MRLFRDCGFWSEERSPKLGMTPREAFATILEEFLNHPNAKDIVLVRVEVETPNELVRLEMNEKLDTNTGFTAMERLAGFSTSIIALEIAAGRIPPGCYPCELAMDPCRFEKELRRRGFEISETRISRPAAPN